MHIVILRVNTQHLPASAEAYRDNRLPVAHRLFTKERGNAVLYPGDRTEHDSRHLGSMDICLAPGLLSATVRRTVSSIRHNRYIAVTDCSNGNISIDVYS